MPSYLVSAAAVADDGQSKQLPQTLLLSEALSGDTTAAATDTSLGTVKQAANIAAVAVPFADLTAAANAHNALLAALKAAGVMVPDA